MGVRLPLVGDCGDVSYPKHPSSKAARSSMDLFWASPNRKL